MASERAAEAARRGRCGRDLVKLGATGLAVEKIRGSYVLVAIFPKKPEKPVPESCEVTVEADAVPQSTKEIVRIVTRVQRFAPEAL